MKTIKQIQDEIINIQKEYEITGVFTKTQIKRAGKRVYNLQKYIYYLQAGAKKKYLIKDLDNLRTKIEIIEQGFSDWLTYNPDYAHFQNPKNKYYLTMERNKIILQIETLEYLLD